MPQTAPVGRYEFDGAGNLVEVAGPRRGAEGPVAMQRTPSGVRIVRGAEALTPEFLAVDSFDFSEERGEVVFSAKRTDNFDIGLVALEGSPISWVPADRSDEVAVRWAPRGNKISYVLRTYNGDFVRTVHVPTATALTVDFPFAVVRSLAWDAPAERIAVQSDSVISSRQVEVMRYGGEERQMAVPPGMVLDLDVIPFAGAAVLLQPRGLRYDERLPLVIWIAAGERNGWNDKRALLLQQLRAGALVTTGPPGRPIWDALASLPWVDQKRIYIVNAAGVQLEALDQAIVIEGDATLDPARYLKQGRRFRVAPAVVESFAAGFIADQAKGRPSSAHR